jgi:diguanylate cyclase (GGDEF)-like protein
LEARRLRGLELAMDHLPVAIGIFSLQGKPIYLNRPFVELYALDWWQEDDASFDRMIERGTFSHWTIDPQQHFKRMMQALLQGHCFETEIDCGASIIRVQDRLLDGHFILSTQSDVTTRVLAERRVRYLADHDALTQLLNRTGFTRSFGQTLIKKTADGGRVGVVALDLDYFKQINDRHGHAGGDAVLVETAARIRQCLDDGDFIGRLGGDEFVLISVSDDQPLAIQRLAARLQEVIEAPIDYEGARLQVGASIGMAVFPEHGQEGAELLKCADLALYLSKAQGRGKISLYEPGRSPNRPVAADAVPLRSVQA